MAENKYKIPMVSVRSLLAYAKEKENRSFSFSLTKKETACISQSTLQDENAVFYQAMRLITDNQFTQPKKDVVIDDLYDVMIYLDFEGIFDRSADDPKVAVRQKKAESLFRKEGITLDFGSGAKQYIAFERSGSMSRNSRLSFVRIDLFNLLLQAKLYYPVIIHFLLH